MSVVVPAALSAPAMPERPKLKRRIVQDGEAPCDALSWCTAAGKAKTLHQWRRACLRTFSGRSLRVAWALEHLFGKHGYAFPSDKYLASETGMALNKVELSLSELEREGAISRVHILRGPGRFERRIFPAKTLVERLDLPPRLGGRATPQNEQNQPPKTGGHNTYSTDQPTFKRPFSLRSSTLQYARQDADRRARRERAAAPTAKGGV